jgi:hypothetical protein
MNDEFWVVGQDVLARTGEIRAKPAASARPRSAPNGTMWKSGKTSPTTNLPFGLRTLRSSRSACSWSGISPSTAVR